MHYERYLEIKVRHIMVVQVLDPQQDLLDEEAGLLLSQPLSLGDEVKQFAST